MPFYWNWFWQCRGYCELETERYRFRWERVWQIDLSRARDHRLEFDNYEV